MNTLKYDEILDDKDWLNCLENRNKDVAEEYAEWHDEIVRRSY